MHHKTIVLMSVLVASGVGGFASGCASDSETGIVTPTPSPTEPADAGLQPGPVADAASAPVADAAPVPVADAAPAPVADAGAPLCASFTYSEFGACLPAGTQSRTVLTSSPAGCAGGAPVLAQACVYVPPPPALDGAALYAANCAGCHVNAKKGRPAAAIQAAIAANIGGMGALAALTPEQIAAIAAAP